MHWNDQNKINMKVLITCGFPPGVVGKGTGTSERLSPSEKSDKELGPQASEYSCLISIVKLKLTLRFFKGGSNWW